MTGTIVAAVVLGVLNMLLQDVSSIRMIVYSLALILVMIFQFRRTLRNLGADLSKLFKRIREVGIMALLDVKNLTKNFGGLTAVSDVTLELNEESWLV